MGKRESKADGQLREIVTTSTLKLDGRVTVDLLDHRGKVVSRQEAPNYVNQAMWDRWAAQVQKQVFYNQLLPATLGGRDPDFNRDPRLMPALFDEILVCWNDTTATNTSDLWRFGEPIAWAHRFGQTTLSTRQGLSNQALHELTNDTVKWGWEWITTNGNGTFQSVGWGRIGWQASTGDPVLWDYPNYSARYFSGFNNSIWSTDASNSTSQNGSVVRTNTAYFNVDDLSIYATGRNATNSMKMVRWPVTFVNGSYVLGTAVDMSANAVFASGAIIGDGATTVATRVTLGLTRLGSTGDWIGCGTTGATTARRPWIRRVNTAGTVAYTNVNVGTFATESWLNDITYDGTNLWAVGGLASGATNRLYQIDAATGNVSSTVTLSGFPTALNTLLTGATATFMGLEWDATHNWFWIDVQVNTVNYTIAVNSSGVWQGVVLCQLLPSNLTLAAPTAAGTTQIYGESGIVTDVDNIIKRGTTAWSATQINSIPSTESDPVGNQISVGNCGGSFIVMDGHIWRRPAVSISVQDNSLANMGWSAFTKTPNFFSRSLLGAPVVKTSANSMRITYEMTFS